jgi:hypothetical protein
MQRFKNFLLLHCGAVTTFVGLTNLLIWIFQEPSIWYLVLGLGITALGLFEWAAEVERDATD